MNAMPEIATTIVLFLGLATVLVWWLAGRRDAGLSLIQEDHTDDPLEALYRLPAKQRDGAE